MSVPTGGIVVLTEAGEAESLRCGYHGRRFGLDGRFRSMPRFDGVEGHPCAADDLRGFALVEWGPLQFVQIEGAGDAGWLKALEELPLSPAALRPDPAGTRDYMVDANWALYVDNFLEGFHIPFVHPELNRVLEGSQYRTELFDGGVLQVGMPRAKSEGGGEAAFANGVAAYYFWFFPNLMLNFYPWGLSLNRVEPTGPTQTRVHYRTYVWDESQLGVGAGGDVDSVELEDQGVLRTVQQGLRSRVYSRGRYSPEEEAGLHHFHRLLATELFGE